MKIIVLYRKLKRLTSTESLKLRPYFHLSGSSCSSTSEYIIVSLWLFSYKVLFNFPSFLLLCKILISLLKLLHLLLLLLFLHPIFHVQLLSLLNDPLLFSKLFLLPFSDFFVLPSFLLLHLLLQNTL